MDRQRQETLTWSLETIWSAFPWGTFLSVIGSAGNGQYVCALGSEGQNTYTELWNRSESLLRNPRYSYPIRMPVPKSFLSDFVPENGNIYIHSLRLHYMNHWHKITLSSSPATPSFPESNNASSAASLTEAMDK